MRSGIAARVLVGLAVLLAALVTGCASSPGTAQGGTPKEPEVVLETDIAYVTRGSTKLLLDVARPAGAGARSPAVLFLHGWAPTFDKYNHRNDIKLAAMRGYVGVAATYRLPPVPGKPGAKFPEPIQDAKAAVRWIRANADRYGIDPERIGVVGYSFGGYLALMVGFTGPADGFEGEGDSQGVSSRVQVAVGAGPVFDWAYEVTHTDMDSPGLSDLVKGFLGGSPEEVPDTYRKSHPSAYMDNSDPPVLAIFGGWDTTVRPEQARMLAEAMKAKGTSHSFLLLPRASHDFRELASLGSDYPVWSFLELQLKAK